MRYSYIEIENFKGIEKVRIDFDKTPNMNIFTLVGLNESGKTTILEAINMFSYKRDDLDALNLPRYKIDDIHDIIPISKISNFNDDVTIEIGLKFEPFDQVRVKKYLKDEHNFRLSKEVDDLPIKQVYTFKNSKYIETTNFWNMYLHGKTAKQKKNRVLGSTSEIWRDATAFIGKLIPTILYFPNFLFDFPDKIFLESYDGTESAKHEFYSLVIQDILDALDLNVNVDTHIINRLKSGDKNDKKQLDGLLLKMGQHVSKTIFNAWNEIFGNQFNDKEIQLTCDIDDKGRCYLEFKLKDSDGYYLISERSLGFRWFFVFLLLTEYRRFRKGESRNVLFLFDEPASNLHPTAQIQLLHSLEKLTNRCKVIYTTHSHHMININWLEGVFIVKNTGLDYSSDDINNEVLNG